MNEELLRVSAAFLTGILISFTGSFIQLRSQNILASTSTLGLDSLSIFWILLFYGLSQFIGIDLSEGLRLILGIGLFFVFGLLLARKTKKSFNIQNLLLLGLGLNLFVGALYSLWQFLFLAFNMEFPTELIFGHFRFVEISDVLLVFSLVACLIIGSRLHWRELELYSAGQEILNLTGTEPYRMSRFFLVLTAISNFLIIYLFGGFAFLGLVLPIVARNFWFQRFGIKGEFIYGAIVNGLLFMLIDYVCYSFPVSGAEIPVGLLSGVIGSFSLILILRKTNT